MMSAKFTKRLSFPTEHELTTTSVSATVVHGVFSPYRTETAILRLGSIAFGGAASSYTRPMHNQKVRELII